MFQRRRPLKPNVFRAETRETIETFSSWKVEDKTRTCVWRTTTAAGAAAPWTGTRVAAMTLGCAVTTTSCCSVVMPVITYSVNCRKKNENIYAHKKDKISKNKKKKNPKTNQTWISQGEKQVFLFNQATALRFFLKILLRCTTDPRRLLTRVHGARPEVRSARIDERGPTLSRPEWRIHTLTYSVVLWTDGALPPCSLRGRDA